MAKPNAKLRIIETTDLHMQVLPYDYFANGPAPGSGLSQAAQVIQELRKDGTETLLFDNGDFIQGNPLADFIAGNLAAPQPHPMIGAMNRLNYDAVCLGNHEFDYGLEFLRQVIRDADFPVLCANLQIPDQPIAAPHTLLHRSLTLSDGTVQDIAIGVVGLLPPQVVAWTQEALCGKATALDIVHSGQSMAQVLRAEGADIVVALCHSGAENADHEVGMENAVIPLAQTGDFDVILAGHTHNTIPSSLGGACPDGKFHGVPIVQAGFGGRYIGEVVLGLTWTSGDWSIASSTSHLHKAPTAPATCQAATDIAAIVKPFHSACLSNMATPLTRTNIPIQSHFSLISGDAALHHLAQAQIEALRHACPDRDWTKTPLVSAVSPILAGGRAGPQHYVDVPIGDITLRDVASIYPFANTIYALEITGAALATWLDRTAGIYQRLRPDIKVQELINPDHPSYNFDVIYGMSYQIDLSKPINRVSQLSVQGRQIEPTDIITVATNSYRASGGAGLLRDLDVTVVCKSECSVRDALIRFLVHCDPITTKQPPPWSFAPLGGARAQFLSAPKANPALAMDRNVRATGRMRDGFAEYELTL